MTGSGGSTGGMVAALEILTVAGAAGIAAGVVAPTSGNTPLDLAVSAGTALTVAVIGAVVTIWINRRRNNADDPTLTPAARMSVLETNQADMKSDIDEIKGNLREILEHVRPWPGGERRKR